MTDNIKIFDTTLRDGEQSPGATMTLNEKLAIAEILDDMGVDIIEAGFARASEGDFQSVYQIAERSKNAVIASLARAIDADIIAAGEAIKPARAGRIHTFVSTSEVHIKHQLKMSFDDVLGLVERSVKLARTYSDDVEWSAMDATRSEIDYLCRAVEIAINNGATTINLPDTVGYSTPHDYAQMITDVRNKVPNIDKAIISTHCHNDLGLAVANSLAGVQAGARQIECSINGLGERAGNASLEEVVMAVKTRGDAYNFATNVDSAHIMRASKLVSHVTGFAVQKNKAIVGENAFRHESGIHQDGVLKERSTYEIMSPEDVGITAQNIVLGKHSGRAAFKDKLINLGVSLEGDALNDLFAKFKALADRKKNIYDDDILSLIDDSSLQLQQSIKVEHLDVKAGSDGQSARVSLSVDGQSHIASAEGQGAVDATYKAIREITGDDSHLELYQVSSVTKGIDAQAEVTVRIATNDGTTFNGQAADVDTMLASAKAYVNALNKLRVFGGDKKIVPEEQIGVGS